MTRTDTEAQVWRVLETVTDPEIPVLTIVDLGMAREVKVDGDEVEVAITPTYTGCPAMDTIEADILAALSNAGFAGARVVTVLSPAWTTDWMSDNGRRKLEAYGIAPPPKSGADKRSLTGNPREVRCPQCGSGATECMSEFGSTACKALYRCTVCREPFDHFKCI
ncbi:MAG: phenylacetate-CoA oxygenase subunit PaaJ [Rhodospirillales bacterium]|nr:phenylacetate-CoA oxygenase subunit PaaJ [Rhodospirillales bacterium]